MLVLIVADLHSTVGSWQPDRAPANYGDGDLGLSLGAHRFGDAG